MVVNALPFDLECPPEAPPENSLVLLWTISRKLWGEHRPSRNNRCLAPSCLATGEYWPCQGYFLAKGGMLAASWQCTERAVAR